MWAGSHFYCWLSIWSGTMWRYLVYTYLVNISSKWLLIKNMFSITKSLYNLFFNFVGTAGILFYEWWVNAAYFWFSVNFNFWQLCYLLWALLYSSTCTSYHIHFQPDHTVQFNSRTYCRCIHIGVHTQALLSKH